MRTLHRIGLLFWKNLTLRRRHYIVTGFEILLPTLFAIIMAYVRTKLVDTPLEDMNGVTFFDEYSEVELVREAFRNKMFDTGNQFPTVPYTPSNSATDAIIQNINSTLWDFYENQNESYYLNCDIELNPCNVAKFIGFDTEAELEAYVTSTLSYDYNEDPDEYREIFGFGIVFTTDFTSDATTKLAYKLRVMSQSWDTGSLFPSLPETGYGYDYNDYYSSYGTNFIGLQILVDRAIIEWQANGAAIPDYQITIQAFPYPPYLDFDFAQLYRIILPQLMILGFIFIVPSIIRTVVSEKETGISELMNLMGLPRWMHWLGYMINSLVVLVFSISIMTILFYVPFSSETGPVFEHTDPFLWWFMLLLYIISATSLCFFISSFFQKTTVAITVGLVVYIVSYFALSFPLDELYDELSLAEKMAISLIPNMALHYTLIVMTGLEGKNIGAKWNNLGTPVSEIDSLCVYHMMIMFLLNSMMYVMLSLYVERVIPSKYGVRKPWYYIFQPSEWGIGKQKYVPSNGTGNRRKSLAYEAEPQDMKVGVEIRNLRKVFSGNKVAVDDLSVKMYEGQITALLGQNGAGKTTTMSMLTGMFGPSGGTAYVNGHDITTDMDSVRDSVALCPQHNMLFNRLTTLEHLIFFGRLRGLSGSKARKEAKQLMVTLKLTEKKDALSMSLSGGQKRKLSLGCALITGAKVLILDEPTSGMDVENRRMLWDMLLEFRGKRTIILTTHFMEEADILGDRIAIMDHGKLQCCGTPMYLKKYYGAGYVLKTVLTPSANSSAILEAVQTQVPEAFFSPHASQTSSELSIVIPTSTTSVFPNLFGSLTARKAELGITAFGLTQTTMDDVFVRVGELSQIEREKQEALENPKDPNSENNNAPREEVYSKNKVTGVKLVFQQFMSLLKKKMLYSLRKKRVIFSQFILPLLLLIASLVVSNIVVFNNNDESPPLTIQMSSYRNPVTPYSSTEEDLKDVYRKLVGPSAVEVDPGTMDAYLLNVADTDINAFRERYIVGGVLNDTHLKAIHSTLASHSPPLAVSHMTNMLLKLTDPNSNKVLEVTNHPFRNEFYDVAWNHIDAETPSIIFGVMVPMGLALLTASFVIMPIEERRCAAKQLQLMTGLSHVVYWGAAFVCDFFFLVVLISVMTAFLPILEKNNAFTNNGGAGVAFLIMLVYGFEAISFSYVISLFTNTVPGGFSLVTIIQILTGVLLNVIVRATRGNVETKGAALTISWIGRFFPSYGVAASLGEYVEIGFENIECELFPEKYRDVICDASGYGYAYSKCCANCADFEYSYDGEKCFVAKDYLSWSGKKTSTYDKGLGRPGILQELTYMLIMGVVYHLILLAIEMGIFKRLLAWTSRTEPHTFAAKSHDSDVNAERQRVKNLVETSQTSNDALIVNNFCKSFGTFSAASNVSFGVHHGECFGLLGVNGAGKTTTFRMLTGDETRSDGNAFCLNYSLENDRNNFLGNLGYCPQFDGIVDVLTGMDMLELFATLRGIPTQFAKKEAEKWINKMGLTNSGNVQCQKYSGGMKRRLCSAIAMIGDPKIVLLDECTTGVDPVARRDFWKIITESRNAGQAIVLTSHSMEECEALCSRLAIMVNGEFQCLGPVQHLKNKFAQGYSLTLKLTTVDLEQASVRALKDRIHSVFQPCFLKDQHQNILQFQLSNTELEWGFLFKTMEDARIQFGEIVEDYSINETTLEEVFLSFARQQYPERKAAVSWFRRFISCQFASR